MEILFVTLSPIDSVYSCSLRNESLIKGFIELGYNVDLLTVDNNTCIKRQLTFDTNSKLQMFHICDFEKRSSLQNVRQKRKFLVTPVRYIYHKIFIFESIGMIADIGNVKTRLKNKYSFVISSSDPKVTHKITSKIIKKQNLKTTWIQYWGDPLANDITRKSMYPPWYLRKVEEKILKFADKIIYTSPFTLQKQKELFSNLKNKMTALPTPYLKKTYLNSTKNDVFVIGYHGNYHSKYRNVKPLINSVERLGSAFRLELIGSTDLNLSDRSNIVFKKPVGDIEKNQQETDLLVVILNRFGTQIPGKLYHIAGINRPILVIVDGDYKTSMKKYILSLGQYFVCENNEEAISDEIIRIKNCNIDHVINEKLSPKIIASNFLTLSKYYD